MPKRIPKRNVNLLICSQCSSISNNCAAGDVHEPPKSSEKDTGRRNEMADISEAEILLVNEDALTHQKPSIEAN